MKNPQPKLILNSSRGRWILLFFIILSSPHVYALTVTINGPSEVCPNQAYTFTATVKNNLGITVTPEHYAWFVMRNGVQISGPTGGSSFTYQFGAQLEQLEVRLHVYNATWDLTGSAFKNVNVRVVGIQSLSGPSVMCFGETQTFNAFIPFSFETCWFHDLYIWTVPPGWTVTSENPTDRSWVTIKAPSTGTPGTYQIKVKGRWIEGWTTPERTLNVTLGPPSTSEIRVQGTSGVCSGNQYVYSATPNVPGNTYAWRYPSNWTKVSQSGNQITLATPSYSTPSGGAVEVNITNKCGSSGYTGISVFPGYSCGSYIYSVYPNPADDEFTVEQIIVQDSSSTSGEQKEEVASREAPTQQEEFSIKLYNEDQKEVSNGKAKKRKVVIDSRKLPQGTYFLHIYSTEGILQKQVIIGNK